MATKPWRNSAFDAGPSMRARKKEKDNQGVRFRGNLVVNSVFSESLEFHPTSLNTQFGPEWFVGDVVQYSISRSLSSTAKTQPTAVSRRRPPLTTFVWQSASIVSAGTHLCVH